jgi:flavin reductase (DIM6/NTAB) family NADH-FMN oxidoreductase RutF
VSSVPQGSHIKPAYIQDINIWIQAETSRVVAPGDACGLKVILYDFFITEIVEVEASSPGTNAVFVPSAICFL